MDAAGYSTQYFLVFLWNGLAILQDVIIGTKTLGLLVAS